MFKEITICYKETKLSKQIFIVIVAILFNLLFLLMINFLTVIIINIWFLRFIEKLLQLVSLQNKYRTIHKISDENSNLENVEEYIKKQMQAERDKSITIDISEEKVLNEIHKEDYNEFSKIKNDPAYQKEFKNWVKNYLIQEFILYTLIFLSLKFM